MGRAALGVYATVGHPLTIWRERDTARREARVISKLPKGSLIGVVYDTETSAAGLGNFLGTALTAKFVYQLGFSVNLFLVDSESRRRPSWSLRSPEEQSQIIQEFATTAKLVAGDSFRFSMIPNSEVISEQSVGVDYLLFSKSVKAKKAFYNTDLALMNERNLIRGNVAPWALLPWDPLGRVGWHVRFGAEDKNRNPGMAQVIADGLALMLRFPGREIVVFSSSEGVEFVREFCKQEMSLFAAWERGQIRGQLAKSFSAAIEEVLTCSVWFQRLGGGIGMVPLFTGMPLVYLSDDSYIFRRIGGQRRKLFFWHTENQKWVSRPVDASFVGIDKYLTRLEVHSK